LAGEDDRCADIGCAQAASDHGGVAVDLGVPHTARAVWYALSVGMIICPVDVPRNSSKADPSTCVMAELLVADATHSEELAS
jgi:hypothetical protein